MLDVRFRPMPLWPYPATPEGARRSRCAFKASWLNTLTLLERELRQIDGHGVVIGGGWRERDIRQDGMPRADARQPDYPGVEVSFEAWIADRRQRLTYATDVCAFWQHNVRSIALGLEALRAVDRYGITRYGEQYAGFKALPPGGPSSERGSQLIHRHGGLRAALHATHPDHGGDALEFADVQAARDAGVAA
jgi:hypothetical protein